MTDEPFLRPMRSALFVPGDKPRALEKTPGLGADVLMLDLEDAVAPQNKTAARAAAHEAIAAFRQSGALAVLRIAEPDSPDLDADLACAVTARPDAVLVAKVNHPDQLTAIRGRLTEAGIEPALWAMVESPRAILNLDAFATRGSALGLTALVAGTNDLAEQLRLPETARRSGCELHLARLVLAARAGGMAALDGVYNAYQDADGFRAEARAGRALGFDGKTLIHPSQVAPANTAFGPDEAEIEWARKVIAAFEDPANAGKGAVPVEGRMVEAMHLKQARAVLAAAATMKD
ncbi:MAG: CoA ester lyase [Alphaproteobacteria bacterium]|nr:CoA ester lyase [Alphaproteobacteria bacterium]